MPERKLNFLLPLLLSVVLVAGMMIGFRLRESTWSKLPLTQRSDFSRLDEIVNLVEEKYVDTFNRGKTIDRLIDDLLEGLDPHSFFIAASDLEGVNESLEGNFEGIGIEFYVLHDTIIVVSPIAGGPSEALGIMTGDKIIRIEDTLVAGIGISNSRVVKKLRGKKGTKVKVSISRHHQDNLLDFVITRDKIPITSVDAGYMIDKETGYVKINRFAGSTYKEFMEEMKRLKNQGMASLIIDLRQNPGGYLNAATMIADEFLDSDKLLVYTEGKAYKRKEYLAQEKGIFEKGNLAIIIDEGSASASEILAGAIQDWDRGIITGRRSFGKGLVQEQYNLSDGSAVRLTVARYYTPSGRSIQRPYVNGTKEYYSEIYNGQYANEDSIVLQDSSKYYTSKGKVVYGGGGIMPDIFISPDTLPDFQTFAKVRGFIPEFIYDYTAANSEQFNSFSNFHDFAQRFLVPDALYQNFILKAIGSDKSLNTEALAKIETDIKVLLKAYIARQLWKNEGYYSVLNSNDKTFLKTAEALKNQGSLAETNN